MAEELRLKITSDASSAKRAFADLGKGLQSLTVGVGSANSGLGGLAAAFGALALRGPAVALGLGAVAASAFAAVGSKAKFAAAESEKYRLGLQNILRDGNAAAAMFERLQTFADKSPFDDLTTFAVGEKLLGMGIGADSLLDVMTNLGDAAGGSAEKFGGLATAFGQMAAKGKIQGEELLQFAERGVPVFQILQEELGKSREELDKLMQGGRLTADAALPAIQRGLAKRYGGGMEAMSESFAGLGSTKDAAWTRLFATIGAGLEDINKSGLRATIVGLGSLTRVVRALVDSDIWKGFTASLKEVGRAYADTWGPIFKVLGGAALGGLLLTLRGLTLYMNVAAMATRGLGAAMRFVGNLLKPVIDFFRGLWERLKAIDFRAHWQSVKEWALNVWSSVTAKAQGALDWLKGWAEWAVTGLAGGINWAINVGLPAAWEATQAGLAWLKDSFWTWAQDKATQAWDWTFNVVVPNVAAAIRTAWDGAREEAGRKLDEAGAWLTTHFGGEIKFAQAAWDALNRIADNIWSWISVAGANTWTAIKNVGTSLVSEFAGTATLPGAVWDALGGIAGRVWQWVSQAGQAAWDAIKNVGASLASLLGGAADLAGAVWNALSEVGGRIWRFISEGAQGIWDGATTLGATIAGKVSEGLRGAIETLWASLPEWVRKVISGEPFALVLPGASAPNNGGSGSIAGLPLSNDTSDIGRDYAGRNAYKHNAKAHYANAGYGDADADALAEKEARDAYGFATGGSFRVGGSGGPDSQLIKFRATPGELVDVRRPGQSGGNVSIHIHGNVYGEADLLDRVAREVSTGIANGVRAQRRLVHGGI